MVKATKNKETNLYKKGDDSKKKTNFLKAILKNVTSKILPYNKIERRQTFSFSHWFVTKTISFHLKHKFY